MNTNSNDIRDLDQLIFKLEVVRREHGNLPVTVSVLQEHTTNSFGTHWEDRPLCNNFKVVNTDGRAFVELSV